MLCAKPLRCYTLQYPWEAQQEKCSNTTEDNVGLTWLSRCLVANSPAFACSKAADLPKEPPQRYAALSRLGRYFFLGMQMDGVSRES